MIKHFQKPFYIVETVKINAFVKFLYLGQEFR